MRLNFMMAVLLGRPVHHDNITGRIHLVKMMVVVMPDDVVGRSVMMPHRHWRRGHIGRSPSRDGSSTVSKFPPIVVGLHLVVVDR